MLRKLQDTRQRPIAQFRCSRPALIASWYVTSAPQMLESSQYGVARQRCIWPHHLRAPSTRADTTLPARQNALPCPRGFPAWQILARPCPQGIRGLPEVQPDLEHGFLRVRCDKCHFERLVAFSCKKRGFCPSCGARRMAETAALLADEVFPDVPLSPVGHQLPLSPALPVCCLPPSHAQGTKHRLPIDLHLCMAK